jgi:methyl-accepting chemotaxis protein
MEERKVSLSCLRDIADENGRFYKVFQDTALKLSKEVEIHMDNLEAAIERTYNDNEELPEKLESIYLTELSLYEKFVDFLQGANEIMHKSNEDVFNEISSTLNLSKEALESISSTLDELSSKYKELKENHK